MVEDLEELDAWQRNQGYPRFQVARMKGVRFGIVDRDRANFLGLHFAVHMIDGGGAASIYLMQAASIEMLQEHGSAENLEGKLCWVKVCGPGASPVNFVRMIQ